MYKIRLLDPRSGLTMDFELQHMGAYVERMIDDGKWVYACLFMPTELTLDGRMVLEFFKRKKKYRSTMWKGKQLWLQQSVNGVEPKLKPIG